MMTLLKMAMSLSLWASSATLNPVKMSFALFIMSTMFILQLSMTTGGSWMPLIFYMLFTGGILIMFMILSSNMPNEKAMKMKFQWMIIIMLTLTPTILITENLHTSTMIKALPQNTRIMATLTMMVTLYFFSFIKFLKEFKSPMRSEMCRKEEDL